MATTSASKAHREPWRHSTLGCGGLPEGELSLDRAVEVLDVLREEQHVFVLVLAGQLDEWIRLQPVGPPTPRRQPHVLESPALELPR